MFDSKAEQEFFEGVDGAVKHTLRWQASDNKDQKFVHLPDCVYFDERANALVFVDYKGGNFPSGIGSRGGKISAEADKQRYLDHDYSRGDSPRARSRHRLARATKGWNHSLWQKVRFVQSLQPMFLYTKIYYVVVCEGIKKLISKDTKVGRETAKNVRKFTGLGQQFVVWDVGEFESWVSSNNVTPYGDRSEFDPEVRTTNAESVPFRWGKVIDPNRHLHVIGGSPVTYYDDCKQLPKVSGLLSPDWEALARDS